MKILGIETSCDETGIAILQAKNIKKPDFKLLSNITASQIKVHQKYGGVYPVLAVREHQKNLIPVLKESLKNANLLKNKKSKISKSKLETLEQILKRDQKLLKNTKRFFQEYKKPEIDKIALTIGPGLDPCLWTGINFAKALSFYWNIPIVPINHIEAHIYANLLPQEKSQEIRFPVIALVVSGGHTQLILIKKLGKYRIVGETRDDAAGECFDKTARILGLPYPGGPAISKQAEQAKTSKYDINLPRPMILSKNNDFSFSGLKTAVLYDSKKRKTKSKKYVQEMSKHVQQAILDVLIKKTIKAARDFGAKTVVLGGGVAANKELRIQLQRKIKKNLSNTKYLQPNIKYCTDNAAMIAITGFFYKNKTKNWKQIKANANLRINE